MEIRQIIKIIESFKNDYVEYFSPVEQKSITEFERKLKIKLPDDYVSFLQFSNGIFIDGDEVFGISNKRYDLFKAYELEHTEVEFPMFDYIVPFSPDGRGNFYCFDIQHGTIIFWVSNYVYNDADVPEVVNDNFLDWFKEVMLDWTIENNGDEIFKK